MKKIFLYLTAWLGMVVLAITNGIIRNSIYSDYMPELAAHQLSTLILLIIIGLYVFGLSKLVKIESAQQAKTIGALWLALTILFEFGFGHYVAGHSWTKLFNDYNLLEGRVWILILIWTAAAPYVFFRLEEKRRENDKVQ